MDSAASPPQKRAWIARAFTVVEDIVYIGLGLLLTGISIYLLLSGVINFWQVLTNGTLAANIVHLLDRILLILLFVELLYTVQVSFREHALVPEPFLLVGLIAAIRRILVLTAEFGEAREGPQPDFGHLIIELAALTLLIVVLVFSLHLLGKRRERAVAERVT